MPTSISAHPAATQVPYSGAPSVPIVDDIRSSTRSERSRAQNEQSEWSSLLPSSTQRHAPERSLRPAETEVVRGQAVHASGPFLAQSIAQDSEREESPSSLRLSVALGAYLRMRDSHIQLLPSNAALDLKV